MAKSQLESHPLLSAEGAVKDENNRLLLASYHALISRFKEQEGDAALAVDKHPDVQFPGMKTGEVAPNGLRTWDDAKRSRGEGGALKQGAGWIAEAKQTGDKMESRWFSVRTWGSWRYAFLLARLQRMLWESREAGMPQVRRRCWTKTAVAEADLQSSLASPGTSTGTAMLGAAEKAAAKLTAKAGVRATAARLSPTTMLPSEPLESQTAPFGDEQQVTGSSSTNFDKSKKRKVSEGCQQVGATVKAAEVVEQGLRDAAQARKVSRRDMVAPHHNEKKALKQQGKESKAKAVDKRSDRRDNSGLRGCLERSGGIAKKGVRKIIALMGPSADLKRQLQIVTAVRLTEGNERRLARFVKYGGVTRIVVWMETALLQSGMQQDLFLESAFKAMRVLNLRLMEKGAARSLLEVVAKVRNRMKLADRPRPQPAEYQTAVPAGTTRAAAQGIRRKAAFLAPPHRPTAMNQHAPPAPSLSHREIQPTQPAAELPVQITDVHIHPWQELATPKEFNHLPQARRLSVTSVHMAALHGTMATLLQRQPKTPPKDSSRTLTCQSTAAPFTPPLEPSAAGPELARRGSAAPYTPPLEQPGTGPAHPGQGSCAPFTPPLLQAAAMEKCQASPERAGSKRPVMTPAVAKRIVEDTSVPKTPPVHTMPNTSLRTASPKPLAVKRPLLPEQSIKAATPKQASAIKAERSFPSQPVATPTPKQWPRSEAMPVEHEHAWQQQFRKSEESTSHPEMQHAVFELQDDQQAAASAFPSLWTHPDQRQQELWWQQQQQQLAADALEPVPDVPEHSQEYFVKAEPATAGDASSTAQWEWEGSQWHSDWGEQHSWTIQDVSQQPTRTMRASQQEVEQVATSGIDDTTAALSRLQEEVSALEAQLASPTYGNEAESGTTFNARVQELERQLLAAEGSQGSSPALGNSRGFSGSSDLSRRTQRLQKLLKTERSSPAGDTESDSDSEANEAAEASASREHEAWSASEKLTKAPSTPSSTSESMYVENLALAPSTPPHEGAETLEMFHARSAIFSADFANAPSTPQPAPQHLPPPSIGISLKLTSAPSTPARCISLTKAPSTPPQSTALSTTSTSAPLTPPQATDIRAASRLATSATPQPNAAIPVQMSSPTTPPQSTAIRAASSSAPTTPPQPAAAIAASSSAQTKPPQPITVTPGLTSAPITPPQPIIVTPASSTSPGQDLSTAMESLARAARGSVLTSSSPQQTGPAEWTAGVQNRKAASSLEELVAQTPASSSSNGACKSEVDFNQALVKAVLGACPQLEGQMPSESSEPDVVVAAQTMLSSAVNTYAEAMLMTSAAADLAASMLFAPPPT
eukprot:TRINITY_DN62246_c0_g1_i1.p1 TRINITY_DN62246_c0_g1~~TRINITY_DN62246_c0_g1_i1.p1  ORF type:complete len:1327 (-),score=242.11 TRINITY_DN62246_c0_g1_i1:92-4072(-)